MIAESSVSESADRREAVRPLALPVALWRIARCAATTIALVARGRLHQPAGRVGTRLTFADGTSARVYRETVAHRAPLGEPVVLVVTFRMWLLNGRCGRAYFRLVSQLNTLLFAGFPGFATKLWLAADGQGRYRGLYEWDGATAAAEYVRARWWPLAVISRRDSIEYRILPHRRRRDLLTDGGPAETDRAWWRLIAVTDTAGRTGSPPDDQAGVSASRKARPRGDSS
jgi:hypothetical protein